MNDYEFPWYASIWWAALIFAISLVGLHVVLIRVLKFDSLRWKQVDYAWVSLALLGIFSNVEQLRSTVARNYASLAATRAEASFSRLRATAEFGTSIAICRTFVRSEFSPPEAEMKEVQREFNAQCEWFKQLTSALEQIPPKRFEPIDISELLIKPPSGGEPMAYKHLTESLAEFNQSVRDLRSLHEEARTSWFHELFLILGPSLLVVAVALRLTKVTGEVRLERAKNRRGQEVA